MIIKRFKLPGGEMELDYLLAGGGSVGTPVSPDGCVPFTVFPKKGLKTVDLAAVTMFCGGSNTEKPLLLKIIASKLGCKDAPRGIPKTNFEGYLELCCVIWAKARNAKKAEIQFITKEQVGAFIEEKYAKIAIDKSWSVLDFYQKEIREGALCFIEEPETGMSPLEQMQFAHLIYDLTHSRGNQFVLTTNSPFILGIPRGVIYDFDRDVVIPEGWRNSRVAKEFARLYGEIGKNYGES